MNYLKYRARQLLGRKQPYVNFDVIRVYEWHFYVDQIRPDMTVFDVGAHLGDVSLAFYALSSDTAQIHTFEPTPAIFERLSTLCHTRIKPEHIHLNQVAVSDEVGEATFYIYDAGYQTMNSMANRPLADYGLGNVGHTAVTMPTVTLDAYCEEHRIEAIDFIKIDVEGAEYQVLRGAERLLRQKRIKRGIFEFGQTTFDMGNDIESLKAYMAEVGYRLWNIVPYVDLFPLNSHGQARFAMIAFEPLA